MQSTKDRINFYFFFKSKIKNFPTIKPVLRHLQLDRHGRLAIPTDDERVADAEGRLLGILGDDGTRCLDQAGDSVVVGCLADKEAVEAGFEQRLGGRA